MTYLLVLSALFGEASAAGEAVQPRDAWAPAVQKVYDQLGSLDLFAAATSLGGMTVKVPAELQTLPMRMVEQADELREKGIEIRLKELQFKDLKFIYEKTPEWSNDRPKVPTMIEFGRLGFSADAETRRATVPVAAVFENGRLPVDFLPALEKGFDLSLLPEERSGDARLDEVRLQVAGPVATGIANRFFSKKVAQLILQHGVGQTLQMGQKDLLAGNSATRLLDVKSDSVGGRAVESLIEALR